MRRISIWYLLPLLLILCSVAVSAQESGDIYVGGFELGDILFLATALLATVLFILTVMAQRRNQNKRLIFVALAFFLFALKGYLYSLELIFGDWAWLDPIANVIDFGILLSFFSGILKR